MKHKAYKVTLQFIADADAKAWSFGDALEYAFADLIHSQGEIVVVPLRTPELRKVKR